MASYTIHIGHVHLKVRDLERSLAFYRDLLGLSVVEKVGRYAFLSGGGLHHEVALQEVGPSAPSPPPQGVGLYHVAFEAPDRRSFALAYQALSSAKVPVAAVDHGISWALYFRDPDGNGLEIYRDTRKESGQTLWAGENERLPPETIRAGLEE